MPGAISISLSPFYLPVICLELIRQSSGTLGALGIIPFDGTAAGSAAPPFLLFVKPGINAYFLLMTNISQHLTVVGSPIVVEIDNSLAGEVKTLGTVGNPFFDSAGSHSTSTAHSG